MDDSLCRQRAKDASHIAGISFELAYQLELKNLSRVSIKEKENQQTEAMNLAQKVEVDGKPKVENFKKQIKREAPLNEHPKKKTKLGTCYNLRRRKTRSLVFTSRQDIVINCVEDPNCFRDRILKKIDINQYHAYTPMSDVARKTLNLYKNNLRSQIDCFTISNISYFVKTWLTTARIFEYKSDKKQYIEVKRIPRRYIRMSTNLITSVHTCGAIFYIGYLSDRGYTSDDNLKRKASYLEVRDIHGELQCKPYYYDQIIKSIESRGDFIYVATTKNVVYIHNKRNFHFRVFKIDLATITLDRLVNISAKILPSSTHSSLQLSISTTRGFIVSHFDALSHTVWQNYDFEAAGESDYFTISTIFTSNGLIIIHRKHNSSIETGNRIIIGCLSKCVKKYDYFIHLATLSFDYDIAQIESDENHFYIFGSTRENGTLKHELGCIDFKDLRPVWAFPVPDVDSNSRILKHENHIIVVKNCQDDYCIKLEGNTECSTCQIRLPNQKLKQHNSHPGIFRNMRIYRNKSLD